MQNRKNSSIESVRPGVIVINMRSKSILFQNDCKIYDDVFYIILNACKEDVDYFKRGSNKIYISSPVRAKEIKEAVGQALLFLEKRKFIDEYEKNDYVRNKWVKVVMQNKLCKCIKDDRIDEIKSEEYINYFSKDFVKAFAIVIKLYSNVLEVDNYIVVNYIYDYFNENYDFIFHYENNEFLIYVYKDKTSGKENLEIINKLEKEIGNIFNISLQYGIGDIYTGVENMRKSYLEALEQVMEIK